jgi:4-hydroxybenzoate polyprenyltransferase
LKETIKGILKLTRYREYMWFVVVTTCLGAIAAYGAFGWQLAVVLLANELAVGFAFMINDVEDAADDARDPAKVKRNPVSAGILSPRAAYVASFVVAALSAALFAVLGRWTFILGMVCLAIAFLYSWRPVRLKAIPFVDLVSHALMLAGLQVAASYFTFAEVLSPRFFWLLAMALAISVYGELFNELRDLEGDLKAGVTHTASVLGEHAARQLATACALFGLFAAFVMLFVVQLVPLWVVGLSAATAILLLVRPVLHLRRDGTFVTAQAPFHKPVEIAAALALSVRVVGPWLNSTVNVLVHSPAGTLVASSPWTQQLLRIWQFQSEQLLRMF